MGLPATENMLLRHYASKYADAHHTGTFTNFYPANIARISLAIDYTSNGYRNLTAKAIYEPALLNAMLAVSASHLSRWQGVPDTLSRGFLRASLRQLRERIAKPSLARQETTLQIILMILSYEVSTEH